MASYDGYPVSAEDFLLRRGQISLVSSSLAVRTFLMKNQQKLKGSNGEASGSAPYTWDHCEVSSQDARRIILTLV